MFASVASLLMGCDEQTVREGLISYTPGGIRQNVKNVNGITLVADCYNAAPESMRGAIDTLCAINISGKRIAVVGDMRELGEGSDTMHRDIGKYIAEKGIDLLFTLGESGKLIADGASSSGMSAENIFSETDTENVEILCKELESKMNEGDGVLIKASRGVRLERVIERLFKEN